MVICRVNQFQKLVVNGMVIRRILAAGLATVIMIVFKNGIALTVGLFSADGQENECNYLGMCLESTVLTNIKNMIH
jgi:hypothetical protein